MVGANAFLTVEPVSGHGHDDTNLSLVFKEQFHPLTGQDFRLFLDEKIRSSDWYFSAAPCANIGQ
jgi:hypothetical protein